MLDLIGIIASLIEPYKGVIELFLEGVGAIVVFATILVQASGRLHKFKYLDKAMDYLDKVLAYMPTLGINPNTKKLQDWYEKQKGK
jgi:hypothetical protein